MIKLKVVGLLIMFQKHEEKRMNEIDIKRRSKSGNEYSVLMLLSIRPHQFNIAITFLSYSQEF